MAVIDADAHAVWLIALREAIEDKVVILFYAMIASPMHIQAQRTAGRNTGWTLSRSWTR
jgi:hypothetical protein